MDEDSQTQMLQEMGFSKEQALEALKVSNNDMNKAISFLFGEVETSTGAGTQESPLQVDSFSNQKEGTVNISNPQEIPELMGSYAVNVSIDEVNHYERPVSEESMDLSMESLESKGEICLKETLKSSSESQYSSSASSSTRERDTEYPFADNTEFPENIKTELTNRPVIFGGSSIVKYWVPILSVLAQSSVFVRVVLESKTDSSFIRELQRILYFVQNFEHSKRWYQETTELAKVLQTEGPGGTFHDEDFVLNMLEYMMLKEPALRTVFESMVESLEDDVNKELAVFEIEADPISSTLYESLNELFWQRDFELLGKIQYKSVSPIVTYQLLTDNSLSYTPFQLSETFYPEIYSDKALGRVQEEVALIRHAQMAYQTSNRKLMDFNFFEGKKIDGFLKQASAALQEANPNASEDIRRLAEKLQGCRLTEQENSNRAKDDCSPRKLAMYEGVIESMPELRPYSLMGVIISDVEYFVREKDTWIEMNAGVTVDFDHVNNSVQNCRATNTITLVYVDAKANEPVKLKVREDVENRIQSEVSADKKSESRLHSSGSLKRSPSILISLEEKDNDTDPDLHPDVGFSEKVGVPYNAESTRLASSFITNSNAKTGSEQVSANKGAEDTEVSSAGHVNSGTNDADLFKRPKWADSDQDAQERVPQAADTTPAENCIFVEHHIVQRFLDDENSVLNGAQ